jgi:hypothetical protein
MSRARMVSALVAAMLLPACSNMKPLTQPDPVTTVKVVNETSYQALPDIQLPPEPALIAWEYSVPRDMSQVVPKDETCAKTPEAARNDDWNKRCVMPKDEECAKTPEAARNDAWRQRCAMHPIVLNSNILLGFDQANLNIMLEDFTKLREYIFQLKQRIDIANAAREDYRRMAEKEGNKEATQAAASTGPTR